MKLYNISTLTELENALNIGLVNLEKYTFPKRYAFAVGRLVIRTMHDDIVIHIDENITKEYMSVWYSSIGKLFFHDLKCNNTDNYFTVVYNDIYYLFKKMNDDDKSYCKKNNIKDYNELSINNETFAIICISYDDHFMTSDFNDIYKPSKHDIDEFETDIENIIEPEYESLELFNDDVFNNLNSVLDFIYSEYIKL